ncbi:MAG: hypothetical protein JNM22_07795 [Saprospiraceae bacterium]|nr:hypothetical protein [Saprospiraceae bacterium]
MQTLLIGSALLSLFHALIPSHWLPILAIGRQHAWSTYKIMWVTLVAGSTHVLSTVLAGGVFAALGTILADQAEKWTAWISPVALIGLGAYYIWAHYYHHHFHLHKQSTNWGIIGSLAIAMFFSPCLEIEGYFLAAGQYGWWFVALLALTYGITTVMGMLVWVWLALHGLHRLNWHAWEHNAGIITGVTLVLSGILSKL